MDFDYIKHRNIESKETLMKYNIPMSNTFNSSNSNLNMLNTLNTTNSGPSEYLRVVNSHVGAGSILKLNTVTNGYSVNAEHFHMVESDKKYLYDIEILIKMKHSTSASRLSDAICDTPVSGLLQLNTTLKSLLDIIGSASGTSDINPYVSPVGDPHISMGHITPILALECISKIFQKCKVHMLRELEGGSCTNKTWNSVELDFSVTQGSGNEELNMSIAPSILAMYQLKYPVIYPQYNSKKNTKNNTTTIKTLKNSNILHEQQSNFGNGNFASIPGLSYAITAACIKLFKTNNATLLTKVVCELTDITPYMYELNNGIEDNRKIGNNDGLTKFEFDRIQYVLNALNEVIAYRGVTHMTDVILRNVTRHHQNFGDDEIDAEEFHIILQLMSIFTNIVSQIPLSRVECVTNAIPKEPAQQTDASKKTSIAGRKLVVDTHVVSLVHTIVSNLVVREVIQNTRGITTDILTQIDIFYETLCPLEAQNMKFAHQYFDAISQLNDMCNGCGHGGADMNDLDMDRFLNKMLEPIGIVLDFLTKLEINNTNKTSLDCIHTHSEGCGFLYEKHLLMFLSCLCFILTLTSISLKNIKSNCMGLLSKQASMDYFQKALNCLMKFMNLPSRVYNWNIDAMKQYVMQFQLQTLSQLCSPSDDTDASCLLTKNVGNLLKIFGIDLSMDDMTDADRSMLVVQCWFEAEYAVHGEMNVEDSYLDVAIMKSYVKCCMQQTLSIYNQIKDAESEQHEKVVGFNGNSVERMLTALYACIQTIDLLVSLIINLLETEFNLIVMNESLIPWYPLLLFVANIYNQFESDIRMCHGTASGISYIQELIVCIEFHCKQSSGEPHKTNDQIDILQYYYQMLTLQIFTTINSDVVRDECEILFNSILVSENYVSVNRSCEVVPLVPFSNDNVLQRVNQIDATTQHMNSLINIAFCHVVNSTAGVDSKKSNTYAKFQSIEVVESIVQIYQIVSNLHVTKVYSNSRNQHTNTILIDKILTKTIRLKILTCCRDALSEYVDTVSQNNANASHVLYSNKYYIMCCLLVELICRVKPDSYENFNLLISGHTLSEENAINIDVFYQIMCLSHKNDVGRLSGVTDKKGEPCFKVMQHISSYIVYEWCMHSFVKHISDSGVCATNSGFLIASHSMYRHIFGSIASKDLVETDWKEVVGMNLNLPVICLSNVDHVALSVARNADKRNTTQGMILDQWYKLLSFDSQISVDAVGNSKTRHIASNLLYKSYEQQYVELLISLDMKHASNQKWNSNVFLEEYIRKLNLLHSMLISAPHVYIECILYVNLETVDGMDRVSIEKGVSRDQSLFLYVFKRILVSNNAMNVGTNGTILTKDMFIWNMFCKILAFVMGYLFKHNVSPTSNACNVISWDSKKKTQQLHVFLDAIFNFCTGQMLQQQLLQLRSHYMVRNGVNSRDNGSSSGLNSLTFLESNDRSIGNGIHGRAYPKTQCSHSCRSSADDVENPDQTHILNEALRTCVLSYLDVVSLVLRLTKNGNNTYVDTNAVVYTQARMISLIRDDMASCHNQPITTSFSLVDSHDVGAYGGTTPVHHSNKSLQGFVLLFEMVCLERLPMEHRRAISNIILGMVGHGSSGLKSNETRNYWHLLELYYKTFGNGSNTAGNIDAVDIIVTKLLSLIKLLRLPDSIRGSTIINQGLIMLHTYVVGGIAEKKSNPRLDMLMSKCILHEHSVGTPSATLSVDHAHPKTLENTSSEDVSSSDSPDHDDVPSYVDRLAISHSDVNDVPGMVNVNWTWMIHLLSNRLSSTRILAVELCFVMCKHLFGITGEANASANIPYNLLQCLNTILHDELTECADVQIAIYRILALYSNQRIVDERHSTLLPDNIALINQITTYLYKNLNVYVNKDSIISKHHVSMCNVTSLCDLTAVIFQCLRNVTSTSVDDHTMDVVVEGLKKSKIIPLVLWLVNKQYFQRYVESCGNRILKGHAVCSFDESVVHSNNGINSGWKAAWRQFIEKEHEQYLALQTNCLKILTLLCLRYRALYLECLKHTDICMVLLQMNELPNRFLAKPREALECNDSKEAMTALWVSCSKELHGYILQQNLLCSTMQMLTGQIAEENVTCANKTTNNALCWKQDYNYMVLNHGVELLTTCISILLQLCLENPKIINAHLEMDADMNDENLDDVDRQTECFEIQSKIYDLVTELLTCCFRQLAILLPRIKINESDAVYQKLLLVLVITHYLLNNLSDAYCHAVNQLDVSLNIFTPFRSLASVIHSKHTRLMTQLNVVLSSTFQCAAQMSQDLVLTLARVLINQCEYDMTTIQDITMKLPILEEGLHAIMRNSNVFKLYSCIATMNIQLLNYNHSQIMECVTRIQGYDHNVMDPTEPSGDTKQPNSIPNSDLNGNGKDMSSASTSQTRYHHQHLNKNRLILRHKTMYNRDGRVVTPNRRNVSATDNSKEHVLSSTSDATDLKKQSTLRRLNQYAKQYFPTTDYSDVLPDRERMNWSNLNSTVNTTDTNRDTDPSLSSVHIDLTSNKQTNMSSFTRSISSTNKSNAPSHAWTSQLYNQIFAHLIFKNSIIPYINVIENKNMNGANELDIGVLEQFNAKQSMDSIYILYNYFESLSSMVDSKNDENDEKTWQPNCLTCRDLCLQWLLASSYQNPVIKNDLVCVPLSNATNMCNTIVSDEGFSAFGRQSGSAVMNNSMHHMKDALFIHYLVLKACDQTVESEFIAKRITANINSKSIDNSDVKSMSTRMVHISLATTLLVNANSKVQSIIFKSNLVEMLQTYLHNSLHNNNYAMLTNENMISILNLLTVCICNSSSIGYNNSNGMSSRNDMGKVVSPVSKTPTRNTRLYAKKHSLDNSSISNDSINDVSNTTQTSSNRYVQLSKLVNSTTSSNLISSIPELWIAIAERNASAKDPYKKYTLSICICANIGKIIHAAIGKNNKKLLNLITNERLLHTLFSSYITLPLLECLKYIHSNPNSSSRENKSVLLRPLKLLHCCMLVLWYLINNSESSRKIIRNLIDAYNAGSMMVNNMGAQSSQIASGKHKQMLHGDTCNKLYIHMNCLYTYIIDSKHYGAFVRTQEAATNAKNVEGVMLDLQKFWISIVQLLK